MERETEIKNIRLANGKQLPNMFIIEIKYVGLHLFNIKYKIDEIAPWIDIGEHPIINGEIILPLKLAFLSYAKEDKIIALELMNKLHSKGVLTWFDEKDLLPGDFWEDKIDFAIEKSDFFIALFSSNTIDKIGYKQREIEYALKQKSLRSENTRYIIPVLLDDCEPPRKLKEIHWLKMWDENWFEKLLMAIEVF